MNKEEKTKIVAELKKKYKDHEVKTTKKGSDYVVFNLGEIEVPEDFKKFYLRVIPNDGKNYLTFGMSLGMNPAAKKQRQEERSKVTEKRRQERKTVKTAIAEIKKSITKETKSGNAEAVKELIEKLNSEKTTLASI